ncbi:MAG: ABC transporter transmembrane domain-containing protein, partial [Pseudomonadota bacterium]
MKHSKKLHSFWGLTHYLWPSDTAIRLRVAGSLVCLILGKAIAMLIPITYKHAVDGVSGDLASLVLIGILLSYGGARVVSQIFNELRGVIFSRVGQRAIRTVSLNVFRHLHDLSMRFHITRKTGGLSRSIERGTKGIESILWYSLHNIIPTIFEMAMVSGFLWYEYGAFFALVTLGTMVSYVAYTLLISEWRISFVKKM